MYTKQELRDGKIEEALTSVTGVENLLLTLQPQPHFTGEVQKIKIL
jgi:hypothetical protein